MSMEEEILKILFPPDGSIPVNRLDEIDLIRSHIDIVIKLSQGFHPTKIGQSTRYHDPDESRKITEKVVELRDTPGTDGKRRTWQAIAIEVGNITPKAARLRYWKYKHNQRAQELAIGEDASPNAEPSQPVVPIKAEIPAKETNVSTESRTPARSPPRIPHSEDDFIDTQRALGMKFKDIHRILLDKGYNCTVDDVIARHQEIRKKRSSDPQLSNGSAHEPVPITRAELDQKIWDMWRSGMSQKQISEALNQEGYYYSEQSVRVRLRAQGAGL